MHHPKLAANNFAYLLGGLLLFFLLLPVLNLGFPKPTSCRIICQWVSAC